MSTLKTNLEKALFILPSLAPLALVASVANARPGSFAANHPRRAEVNGRQQNQNARIRQGVKDGTITKDQAKELHGEVRQDKKEERDDVKANGGYLTKAQQTDINKNQNQVSKEIYTERHNDTPAPTSP